MRARRVTDIVFPGSPNFGSGYFLTDRLVLTAGHVVEPRQAGTRCVAHRWKYANDDLHGTVAWVSTRPDIALILLDASVVEDLGPAPRFGRPALNDGGETYECLSIGFPEANRTEDDVWIDKTVRGTATQRFNDMFDVVIRDLKPVEAQGWRGLSGAALFSRDLLLAVFKSVPEDWGGTSLDAAPLWPLLSDAQFRAVLAEGGMADPQLGVVRHSGYYRSLSDKVGALYCFLDRIDQEKDFRQAFEKEGKRAFYIEGESHDRPDMLIQRFAREPYFRDEFGDVRENRAVVELEWPAFTIDGPDQALASFRTECARRLGLAEDLATPAEFAEALIGRRVAVWWHFNPNEMGPGHAELLERWTDFCAAIQAKGAAFCWFLCLLGDPPPPPRSYSFGRRRREPDARVGEVVTGLIDAGRVIELEPLNPIRSDSHVRPWVARITGLATLSDSEREDLNGELVPKLGMVELPLARFCNTVESTLRGFDD